MANWNIHTVPKCKKGNISDEVLVTWIPKWNKNAKFVSKAVYIPYHNCTNDDLGWDITNANVDEWDVADEDENTYWVPDGWYETIDNSIHDCNYVLIDGEVIAWMKVPKAYEPSLKQLN